LYKLDPNTDQEQDDPVPECFERRVVKNGPLVNAGRLQLVLRHHLSPQGQYLKRSKQNGLLKRKISYTKYNLSTNVD
jgi:hypothetical protein